MYELPTTIIINEKEHPITQQGDYRMIINGCFSSLNDPELDKQYRVVSALICFYEELNDIEDIERVFGKDIEQAVEKMFDFIQCGEKEVGRNAGRSLIDWDKDSNLICSAINKVSPVIDIRAEKYIHWFTFMSWYLGVGEGLWATIVGIREKIVKGKKLEKWEREFKRNSPEYFVWNVNSVERKEINDLVNEIWNGGEN